MNEEKDNFHDEEIVEAVNRFKRSLVSGRTKYFDVSEFEGIVEQLLEEGDIQGSEIAARQGIRIHPNAIPLQLKYAQILINKGHYRKALDYLEAVEKVDSGNHDVYLLKGTAQMVTGNEKEAQKSFKNAILHAGSDIDETYYQIGATYLQIGNIRKALHFFEKTVKENPEHDLALYDLGYFYDQEDKINKSIKYYNLYLDIDPFNQYVWFNLGTVYNKADKFDKALEAYEFAFAINEKFHMALFNIGNTLANAGRFDEAITKYNEFLQYEPKSDEAYCYIGECYLNLEKYEESGKHYKRAAEINNGNDTAWFGLGLLQWIGRNFDSATRLILKALKIDGQNSEYWLTLGKIHKDSGEKEASVEALKTAARIDVENPEIWLTWADVYMDYDEPRNAIRILKKAISKNDDAVLKYKLVSLLLQKRKTTQALGFLAAALEQDFQLLSFLHDIYPNSRKNKRVNQLIKEFVQKNTPEIADENL